MEDIKRKLERKQTFLEAVAQLQERCGDAAEVPLVSRTHALLKARYTSVACWKAGMALFKRVFQHSASLPADARAKLQTYLKDAVLEVAADQEGEEGATQPPPLPPPQSDPAVQLRNVHPLDLLLGIHEGARVRLSPHHLIRPGRLSTLTRRARTRTRPPCRHRRRTLTTPAPSWTTPAAGRGRSRVPAAPQPQQQRAPAPTPPWPTCCSRWPRPPPAPWPATTILLLQLEARTARRPRRAATASQRRRPRSRAGAAPRRGPRTARAAATAASRGPERRRRRGSRRRSRRRAGGAAERPTGRSCSGRSCRACRQFTTASPPSAGAPTPWRGSWPRCARAVLVCLGGGRGVRASAARARRVHFVRRCCRRSRGAAGRARGPYRPCRQRCLRSACAPDVLVPCALLV